MSEIELAIVDIGPFVNGDAVARRRVARAFGEAFETTGFAVIVGHGVSPSLANDVHACMKAFFALPLEAKLAYTPPERTKARGYVPIGVERVAKTLDNETPPDLCEALAFTAPHRPDTSGWPAIWPERPERLRALVQAWCGAMLDLTHRLMHLSALALDLPDTYFAPWFEDPMLGLRFVNYPDQSEAPRPGQLRYGAHHDYGGLTILRQESAPGGLQICDAAGEWKDVGLVPDSFVINVGDLMARWTNDRWRSTLHRVANPGRQVQTSTQRLSMVAFTGPNEASEVACLPTCCGAENPPRYEPVIAGRYVLGKLTRSMAPSPVN
jgi:isopenicillin N synthase-like dioxygenase